MRNQGRYARTIASLAVASCALLAAAPPLHAQPGSAAPGGNDRVQSAAAEYDAGRRAFMEQKYEEAAVHFENAWHDAPRAEALRNAIRARREAKQLARAATLAMVGERVYGDDVTTMVVVRDTLNQTAPKLHKVTLACKPDCELAADGRAVTFENGKLFTFFLEPGPHDVVVTWSDDRSKQLKIVGKAGGSEVLSLDAPVVLPPPVVKPVVTPVTEDKPPPPVHEKPFGPVVFFVGAGLTAAGVAATIVSGVDAKNNPGEDAVRRDCAGQGESCPTYQQGRDAQLRTNVLLGATVGVGVLTGVIGFFFTQWSSPAHPNQPRAGRPSWSPSLAALPGGAHVGLAGAF
jgi:hypothetical protein